MTTKEIYKEMKWDASRGFAYYIGFISSKKYNMIVRMVEQFKDDAIIDRELGVLDETEYEKEINKYNLMKKSLETAEF